MASTTERTYRLTTLATSFCHPRGRAFVTETYPRVVAALYDATVSLARWTSATTPAQRALAIALAIDGDAELEARIRVDLDEGLLTVSDAVRHADAGADGLLGGTTGTAWRPERMARPGIRATRAPHCVDVVQSWLHAELVGGAPPLVVGTAYTLAVFFGTDGAGAVADETWLPFPEGQDTLEVRVRVMSSDFDVPADPQRLRIGRDGRSTTRALFDIRPRERRRDDGTEAPHGLSVLVDVRGNFLQRLDVTFDRGAVPDLESYGRQPAAAAVLDERCATIQIKPSEKGYELLAPQVCADPMESDSPRTSCARASARCGRSSSRPSNGARSRSSSTSPPPTATPCCTISPSRASASSSPCSPAPRRRTSSSGCATGCARDWSRRPRRCRSSRAPSRCRGR